MELHRSLLFVPAIRENMLQKAVTSEADVIVLDLEDSVPPAEKAQARELARRHAPLIAQSGRSVHLRVNAGQAARDDIAAVLCSSVSGVSLPKVQGPQDVRDIDIVLREFELKQEIKPGLTELVVWIETARGLLRTEESLAASTRVSAAALGHEDYSNDLGVQRTSGGAELDYARSVIAVAAVAAGVTPLDGPYSNFRDVEGARAELEKIKQMGYRGKFCIHPAQLADVNAAFTPAADDVAYARRVVDAYEQAEAQGRGAVQLDGKMIDLPVARRARRLIEAAEAIERRSGLGPGTGESASRRD
jgi:citrate lyase subunit beta/citryl-CoA lyase